jgi:glycosyltransferase involved in cell wall biosynthesis
MNKLAIIIPALNEEKSIKQIIQRCLDIESNLSEQTKVKKLEVIVVSDGSTDNTVSYAQCFNHIKLIIFKENQGYGAAIKAGFSSTDANYLAFIDADNTCDPNYFIQMCHLLDLGQADVVLGSRLNNKSKMPFIRRVGNMIFAKILATFSQQKITDSASGMRVLKREVLSQLYPLPDGLHFTPAMSAKALMLGNIKLTELPMAYHERTGQSKLSVIRDGWRFLKAIMGAIGYLRPSKLTNPICFLFGIIVLIYLVTPLNYLFKGHEIADWMIYRFLFVLTITTLINLIYCTSIASQCIINLNFKQNSDFEKVNTSIKGKKRVKFLVIILSFISIISLLTLSPGIESYLVSGKIFKSDLHWSSVVFAAGSLINLAISSASLFIIKQINYLKYEN